MSSPQVSKLDMDKLNAFIGQFVSDLGAAVHTGMVVIGERLGLYKALANRPDDFRRTGRGTPKPMSAICASGWRRRPPAATSAYDETDGQVLA